MFTPQNIWPRPAFGLNQGTNVVFPASGLLGPQRAMAMAMPWPSETDMDGPISPVMTFFVLVFCDCLLVLVESVGWLSFLL